MGKEGNRPEQDTRKQDGNICMGREGKSVLPLTVPSIQTSFAEMSQKRARKFTRTEQRKMKPMKPIRDGDNGMNTAVKPDTCIGETMMPQNKQAPPSTNSLGCLSADLQVSNALKTSPSNLHSPSVAANSQSASSVASSGRTTAAQGCNLVTMAPEGQRRRGPGRRRRRRSSTESPSPTEDLEDQKSSPVVTSMSSTQRHQPTSVARASPLVAGAGFARPSTSRPGSPAIPSRLNHVLSPKHNVVARLSPRPHPQRADPPHECTTHFRGRPQKPPTMTSFTMAEWRTWDSVQIYITGLPSNVTTLDLSRNFSKHGNISSIDIIVNHKGEKAGQAKLRFRPPPRNAFFEPQIRNYPFEVQGSPPCYVVVSIDKTQISRKRLVTESPIRRGIEYPQLTELVAQSVGFGVLVAPQSMLVERTCDSEENASQKNPTAKFILDLYHKDIDVRFCMVQRAVPREHRFRVSLDQVSHISQIERNRSLSFILTLESPPRFSRKLMKDLDKTHDPKAFDWREEEAWTRQTDIVAGSLDDDRRAKNPTSLKKDPEGLVNIGRWRTFKITFAKPTLDAEKFRIITEALRDFNIPIIPRDDFKSIAGMRPVWDYIETPNASSTPATSDIKNLSLEEESAEDRLDFPVRYALETCISQGKLNEYNLGPAFVKVLAEMPVRRATKLLEDVSMQKFIPRFFDPMDIFTKVQPQKPWLKKEKVLEKCVVALSVTITPSTIVLNLPYFEMTNRVIREYKEHADRFLRVQFEDDQYRGYSRISATTSRTNNEVFTRIHRTLTNGIIIGGRHYEFLAFGNSQLREHRAYFFASLPHLTAGHIRAWMGRFHHERIIAKHAARMGQCFSTTRVVKSALMTQVRSEQLFEDVERNGYTFTDGVGQISDFLAKMIAHDLKIPGAPPSAFQFRLAGCKGMLAVSNKVRGVNVYLRKSQHKFEADHRGLEIIRSSEFCEATLNRQLILVMSHLGVKTEVFLNLQARELTLLEEATHNEDSAIRALKENVDPNGMSIALAKLVAAGFLTVNEPFVTSLLHLWRSYRVKYLKEKAKLHVSKGAFLLGTVDETATLKGHFDKDQQRSGETREEKVSKLPEIFVQITSPESGERKIIEGICVIARNPSLHAGDIRVVKATNVSALHHLCDVLVLPQTGDRDLSSMCSGGDLDGDDYIVIWDQELLPEIWNVPPMDYTPPIPKLLDRDVTQLDITKFFVQYMKNDFLPKIAHAHLAWADWLDDGIQDEKCLELANLHSKAVDYPKTGQPAQMPKSLNVIKWPHFMEKKNSNTYRSQKVLGKLYDAVQRVAFIPDYEAPFDERILGACEPSEDTIRAAYQLKHEYDISIQRIMVQHDIATEFEVWSTFVLDHSKASGDYKFHEEIGHLSQTLKEHFYESIVERVGGRDAERLIPFAVASYRIVKQEVDSALKEVKEGKKEQTPENMPLITFPWVLHETLVKIVADADRFKKWNGKVEILPNPGDSKQEALIDLTNSATSKPQFVTSWWEKHLPDPFEPEAEMVDAVVSPTSAENTINSIVEKNGTRNEDYTKSQSIRDNLQQNSNTHATSLPETPVLAEPGQTPDVDEQKSSESAINRGSTMHSYPFGVVNENSKDSVFPVTAQSDAPPQVTPEQWNVIDSIIGSPLAPTLGSGSDLVQMSTESSRGPSQSISLISSAPPSSFQVNESDMKAQVEEVPSSHAKYVGALADLEGLQISSMLSTSTTLPAAELEETSSYRDAMSNKLEYACLPEERRTNTADPSFDLIDLSDRDETATFNGTSHIQEQEVQTQSSGPGEEEKIEFNSLAENQEQMEFGDPADEEQIEFGSLAEDQEQMEFGDPADEEQIEFGDPAEDQGQMEFGDTAKDQVQMEFGDPAYDREQMEFGGSAQEALIDLFL